MSYVIYMLSVHLLVCNQLETKTVGDQLEGVRGERNHAPKEKVQETGAEASEIEERMSATTSINMAYYHMRCYWTSNGLELQISTDEILKKKLES